MAPSLGGYLSNFIHPVYRLSTAPVSDETPLRRLVASDRQLRDLETELAATRQAIDSFCDGGLEPPQSLVDSLSSLSRELVDARRISSDLHGANRPLHSGLGFRLIGNNSLLLLLVHLCPGDIHMPSHLASLPQIRLVTHFAQGVTLPPIKGVGYQSKIHLMSTILCRPPATGMSTILCRSPATGRRRGRQGELSPCLLGAVT